MPPHLLLLPQVHHIHLQALLLVLVSRRPVPTTAQRVPATVRLVLRIALQVHRIPPLRRRLARLLVSHPPAQSTAQQVLLTPLRVPTTILRPPASSRALRARSTALLVLWATHLRALNLPLDQIQDQSVPQQVLRSGRPQ